MTLADAQYAFALTLVDEWARAGATDAVVAPGSRSTPLLHALDSDGRIRVHVVLDERGAGFVALGLGAASGRPAPVVTTSGTAAVELHPAVVEAHHARVPLLAVTADRPPELHDVGAPQTVDQVGLYGGAVRFAASPGPPELAAAGAWRSLAARAWATARGGPDGPGPVHLNLAFREPLLASDPAASRALVPEGRPGGAPWHAATGGDPGGAPPADVVAALTDGGERGLIVAGDGCGDPEAVLAMAGRLGWPVLADPRSGCRLPHPTVVASADALLRTTEVARWSPDVVVRLGQPWASKVMAGWLAGLPAGTRQVLVDPWGQWADPDRRVDVIARLDPTALCRAVAAAGPPVRPSSWLASWQRAEAAAAAAIDAELAADPALSEPAVARTVAGAVADGTTVVASSSMPVRDVEWFAAPRLGVRFLANRGANGIDGVVSTTLGVALAGAGAPVVGLVGDLAFLYDAGALLWAARRAVDCTLVVVDNDGGGIFSFLPQATATDGARFERLWGTPHGLDLAAVAAAYGVAPQTVTRAPELAEAVRRPGAGVRVVLARTARQANVAVHDRLNAAVQRALA